MVWLGQREAYESEIVIGTNGLMKVFTIAGKVIYAFRDTQVNFWREL